jgi:mono/diheme cytochrome c family protein
MKLRTAILILVLPLILAACSFSLAEDITPPPNYISPTPPPTLGPLYPAQPASLERGAQIYAEKCEACHGLQGLGDGPDGKQLPVTVTALGLPQTARPASPADWYKIVSTGNIERFMPPFTSLTDQQRWDVTAYAMSFHVPAGEIERGKTLFESNCQGCSTDFFKDQAGMAAISDVALVSLLKTGNDNVTAIAGTLTDEDYYAVAAWARTLTYEASLPTPTPEPATAAATETAATVPAGETPLATETGAAGVVETPSLTGSETPASPTGTVSGKVTGENVAAGTAIKLHILAHGQDAASGPQEILVLDSTVNADGFYSFSNVPWADGQLFYSETTYDGIVYESEMTIAEAGASKAAIADLKLHETSTDYSVLTFSQVHIFMDISGQTAQMVTVYTFDNTTDKTILVQATSSVPFIKLPDGAQNVGFDLSQESAPILAAEGGFALPPNETPYGIVVIYNLPYDKKMTLAQTFDLPTKSVLMLAPEGLKIKSGQMVSGGIQTFQEVAYQEYNGGNFNAGDTLSLEISGTPKNGSSATTAADPRQNLLIGVGALGLVLILVGGWMYLRDRNRPAEVDEDEDEEQDGFESQEDLLDAIIALDDLHRSGKISDAAYHQRRAELKSRLK